MKAAHDDVDALAALPLQEQRRRLLAAFERLGPGGRGFTLACVEGAAQDRPPSPIDAPPPPRPVLAFSNQKKRPRRPARRDMPPIAQKAIRLQELNEPAAEVLERLMDRYLRDGSALPPIDVDEGA